ncbi:MAG: HNH endonuclease signature motif containing protein [Actinomycetota bacterium]|nr:HNH endonuclease signature motif containing protein [Actinomycetota bacterium]
MGAHRFAYAAFVGDIPEGMEIDHTCRDRGCVNPEHLELVTRQVNLSRRDRVGGAFAATSIEERIASRTDGFGTDQCWVWTGALVRGYGVMSLRGRTRYVHRVTYELLKGSIGSGLDLDHVCRNPRCINPDHLEPVTRSENVARMLDKQPKDRCRRGHRFADVGRTTQGSCVACYEVTASRNSRRAYVPRRTEIAERCARGHEYALVGRFPSGRCRQCQADIDFARGQRKNAVVERFCAQGHDTWDCGRRGTQCRACWDEGWCAWGHDMNVVGRTRRGACLGCRSSAVSAYAMKSATRDVCGKGHVLSEVGVNPANGECRECARLYARRKYGYKSTAAQLVAECRNGHPRSEDNTLILTRRKNGKDVSYRECLVCRGARYERFNSTGRRLAT